MPLHVTVEVMAGQEWSTSICLTQTSNVPPIGLSLPLLLEGVDDHLLEVTLVILCCRSLFSMWQSSCLPERSWNWIQSSTGNTTKYFYVSGVSVTHGPAGSRQHIVTFAAALDEQDHT